MGRIQDALKKAEEERQRKRGGGGGAAAAEAPRPAQRPVTETVQAPMAPVEIPASPAPGSREVVGTVTRSREAGVRGYGEALLAYHDPNDYRTEQFRALRTNLHVLDPEPAIIGITSAVAGEGTGITAANLAVSFAEESEKPILVVDADLRHPELDDIFGFDRDTVGLVEMLEGSADHDRVIQDSGIRGVSYVASGRSAGNPGGLISASPLSSALTEWRKRFERVIVIMPSVTGTNDAAHIGRDMEGVLMVVKLGVTPRKKTERAVDVLAASGVPLIGCVLTNADSELAEVRS